MTVADTPILAVMPDGSRVIVMVSPETAAAVTAGHQVVTGDRGQLRCAVTCPVTSEHVGAGDDRG